MIKDEYYVYTYSCPDTGDIKYVGMGKNDRAFQHLKGSHNRRFALWINNTMRSGKLPKIEIYPQSNESSAEAEEIRLIAEYGRLDLKTGKLFNRTSGGRVVPDFKRTPKYKKNLSESMKNNTNALGGDQHGTVVSHSEESRKKMSEGMKRAWAERKRLKNE